MHIHKTNFHLSCERKRSCAPKHTTVAVVKYASCSVLEELRKGGMSYLIEKKVVEMEKEHGRQGEKEKRVDH